MVGAGEGSPSGGPWEFWSHFPMSRPHCGLIAAIRRLTVVVGLVLSLQPRDGQAGGIGGTVDGAREPIRNPRRSLVISIDHSGWGTARALLVPVHRTASNAAAGAGAGDGDLLSWRPRHRGGLSQHQLGPGPCKEGATQRSGRTEQAPFPGREERSSSQVTHRCPPGIPCRPHLCTGPGGRGGLRPDPWWRRPQTLLPEPHSQA